ncbi:MAG: hypothetical protein U0992_25040 [Planctomycetaceae bacterium]
MLLKDLVNDVEEGVLFAVVAEQRMPLGRPIEDAVDETAGSSTKTTGHPEQNARVKVTQ